MLTGRTRTRLIVLRILVMAMLVTLAGRLWYIQIRQGPDFRQAAAANHLRTIAVPAVRGQILDDVGRPLVNNVTGLTVTADRSQLTMMSDGGKAVLDKLAGVLAMPATDVEQKVRLCGPKIAQPCWNGSPYQPIPVTDKATTAQALEIAERHDDFPGIAVAPTPVRNYPSFDGLTAAQILGYISPVSQDELAKNTSLQPDDLVGRSGLEESYDSYLRGTSGVTKLAVDNIGRVISTVSQQAPAPGDDLVTSIDARVQAVAEQQLAAAIDRARGQISPTTHTPYIADSGAAVVMDVNTGRVVAMATYPSYNPAVWVGGISQKNYAALSSTAANVPMLSRAFQGEFAPGSTFKVVTTSAMGKAGFDLNGDYDCSPSFKIGNFNATNFEGEQFGSISLKRAIEVSCDTVFYGVAADMWNNDGGMSPVAHPADPIQNMADAYGLGHKTGIDLPGEASGQIVQRSDYVSTWLKNKAKWCKRDASGAPEDGFDCYYGQVLPEYETAFEAIGQAGILLTPLQLARTYAAVANGGTLYQPQLGRAVVSQNGAVVKNLPPIVQGHVPVPADTLDFLHDALNGVATEGTAAPAFSDANWPMAQIPMAAKTGTAEVQGKQTTSVFAAYAPVNHPRYVVVMMVSQGGTGVGTSGPSVEKIMETLFGVDNGVANPAQASPPGVTQPPLPVVRPDGTVVHP